MRCSNELEVAMNVSELSKANGGAQKAGKQKDRICGFVEF